MTWVFLDDKFHSNPKILQVGLPGAGLYACALSYCGDHLTDGFVPDAWAKRAAPKSVRDSLEHAGLWERIDGGYLIPDYLTINPSKVKVEQERADARERMRRLRSGRTAGEVRANNGRTSGEVRDSPSPTPSTTSKEDAPTRDAAPLKGTVSQEFLHIRLVAAAGGGPQVADKIANTLRGYGISEHDLTETIRAATGPGVKDPLGVTLSELTKRRRKVA